MAGSEPGRTRARLGLDAPRPISTAIWVFLACVVVGVALLVAGAAAGGGAGTGLLVAGVTIAGIGVIAAPIEIVVGRHVHAEIAGLLGGLAVAHWHYTAADLDAWAGCERSYRARELRLTLIVALSLAVPIVVIGAVAGGGVGAAVGLAAGVGVALFAVGLSRLQTVSSDLPVLDGADPEVYVGTAGIYQPGARPRYVRLGGFGQTISDVRTEPGPPVTIVWTEDRQSGRGGTIRVHLRVAVPAGHEDEGARIVAQY